MQLDEGQAGTHHPHVATPTHELRRVSPLSWRRRTMALRSARPRPGHAVALRARTARLPRLCGAAGAVARRSLQQRAVPAPDAGCAHSFKYDAGAPSEHVRRHVLRTAHRSSGRRAATRVLLPHRRVPSAAAMTCCGDVDAEEHEARAGGAAAAGVQLPLPLAPVLASPSLMVRWQRFVSLDKRQAAERAAGARRCVMCDAAADVHDGLDCARAEPVAALPPPRGRIRRAYNFFTAPVRWGARTVLAAFKPSEPAAPPALPAAPRHFICRECLEGYVTFKCTPGEGGGSVYDTGELFPPCRTGDAPYMGAEPGRAAPAARCDCAPYRHKTLATALSDGAFAAFERAREHWVQDKAVKEEAAVAAAQAAAGVVQRHVDVVTERILTAKCPRCAQAFVDFEGCFALTCSRLACAAKFCAWCLADCGADAHAHVLVCPCNPTRPISYFATASQFDDACAARRKRDVAAYVAEQLGGDAQLRAAVLARLAPILRLHGIKNIK
jgi:hypothetical protein